MRLDRNTKGHQKYALLKLRRLEEIRQTAVHADVTEVERALAVLENAGIVDYGPAHTDSEFFVMRLKDIFSHAGLDAYARAATAFEPEYGGEVNELARRSGFYHPSGGKYPD